MSSSTPGWKRMSFKGNKVWVATDDSGELSLKNGKVLMKYNLKQDYEYWIKPENLKSDAPENLIPKGARPKNNSTGSSASKNSATSEEAVLSLTFDEPGVIHMFTDGAASGNPGPAGIGILLRFDGHEKEISRSIGNSTNNIAELEAIRTGLLAIKNRTVPVRIYTDSSYALGLLSKGWKPKKNQELVQAIKELIRDFTDIVLIKVKGHSGIPENERADKLATSAISK